MPVVVLIIVPGLQVKHCFVELVQVAQLELQAIHAPVVSSMKNPSLHWQIL